VSPHIDEIHCRTTRAFDGVPICYSTSGAGSAAILFIHGGLADRSFWDGQHVALNKRFTVVALDLAGHGDSGQRQFWGIQQCAKDVVSVIEAEHLNHVILVGNSLGGPVAIETAALLGARALGVIGVDTFQDLNPHMDAAWAREQAEAWRCDFQGSMDRMVKALFHPDAPPSLVADVKRRMSATSVDTACAMFLSFGGYDLRPAARRLHVPVRCINGDLFPTDVIGGRGVITDFDAVVLPHAGHYPMLESPNVFNRSLAEVAEGMAQGAGPS
jgi:pimeloyl-ACP methyl ester carboxylesterase